MKIKNPLLLILTIVIVGFSLIAHAEHSGVKDLPQAMAGDTRAQFKIGVEYLVGNDSLTTDKAKAYFWLTIALENGLPGDAQMMAKNALKNINKSATAKEIEEGEKYLKQFRKTGDWEIVLPK